MAITNRLPRENPKGTTASPQLTNITAAHTTDHLEGHKLPDKNASEDAVKDDNNDVEHIQDS
jgi:hypothetical protein